MTNRPTDRFQDQLLELKRSFEERGYAFSQQIDTPGRIWRNLYCEAEEVFVALTPGLSLSIEGQLKPAVPFEEVYLDAGTIFDIVGSCECTCHWVYGYEIAGTCLRTRIMRRSGVLQEEDWIFANLP